MESPYLTVQEAAEMLRISRQTLYARIYKGEVTYTKSGGRVLIPRADLAKQLERHTIEARG